MNGKKVGFGSGDSKKTGLLISSGIANSRFVPAGVMATTRAQEYGYSLLCSGR